MTYTIKLKCENFIKNVKGNSDFKVFLNKVNSCAKVMESFSNTAIADHCINLIENHIQTHYQQNSITFEDKISYLQECHNTYDNEDVIKFSGTDKANCHMNVEI
jgi:hypothetical protein